MPDLITLEVLLEHVDTGELHQIAGVGSHNQPEGRALDVPKIDAAITFASDLATGYILKRYPQVADLLTDDVPELLQGYVADMTRYRLRSRTGNSTSVSDEVDQRYKDAIGWLKDVSHGRVNLDFGNGLTDPSTTTDAMGKISAKMSDNRSDRILHGFLE